MKSKRMRDVKTIENVTAPCQELNNMLYAMYRRSVAFTVDILFYKNGEQVYQLLDVVYDMSTLWYYEGRFNDVVKEKQVDSVSISIESLSMNEFVELIKRGELQ